MGLTVGCARCHDHKFDPDQPADYYGMAGIFKSSKTMDNFKVVAKWHEYVLAPKADRDRLAAHEAKVEAKRKEIADVVKGGKRETCRRGYGRDRRVLSRCSAAASDARSIVAPGGIRAWTPSSAMRRHSIAAMSPAPSKRRRRTSPKTQRGRFSPST